MRDSVFSIEEFPEWLRHERDMVKRRVARFLFDLSGAVQKQTIRNIKATFQNTPRSTMGGSGKPTGSARGLANSVIRRFTGDGEVTVSVGGVGVPYAAIHEYGGPIEPVKAKWLTIPNSREYPWLTGKRAGEFDGLQFVPLGPGRAALIDQKLAPGGADDDEGDVPFQSLVMFWLRKKVMMPERPYFQPAVDDVLKGQEMTKLIARHFALDQAPGSGSIPGSSVGPGGRGSLVGR